MRETESMYQMEAGEVETGGIVDNNTIGTCYALASPATPPAQEEYIDTPRFEQILESSPKKRKVNSSFQDSLVKDTTQGVSNRCLFKSQLQEYCQKVRFASPVYEVIKEGRSHEPLFRSTVIVDNVRYDSLPGFLNRRTAEQSAAEVALMSLANSPQPIQETGLCKNALQEYAQRMNYAIPLYECTKEERKDKTTKFTCVVQIGGIKYIGASASSKKEAELKAARTAMLAIQSAASSSPEESQTPINNYVYTVVPQRKKLPDIETGTNGPAPTVKQKKRSLKRRQKQQEHRNKRRALKRSTSDEGTTRSSEVKGDSQTEAVVATDGGGPQVMTNGGSEAYLCSTTLEVKAHSQTEADVATDGGGPQVTTNGGSEAYTCSTTLDNGNTENTKASFDACLKEGDCTTKDAD